MGSEEDRKKFVTQVRQACRIAARLRQFLNGVLTADATDLDEPNAATAGVLALQLHAGLPMSVQFKNILLKTLP